MHKPAFQMLALVAVVAMMALGVALGGPRSAHLAVAPVGVVLALRGKRKKLLDEMRPLSEKETLTADEETRYRDLSAQGDALAKQIERAEAVEGMQRQVDARDPNPGRPAPEAAASAITKPQRVENPGFESLSEMVFVATQTPHDSRIVALMEMGTGTSGGMAVPDEFLAPLLEVPASAAIVRPRATILSQGAAPDAEVTMPGLEQGSGANMYGGVAVDWIAEGVTTPETNAKIREIALQPKEVGAHIVVTNKLMANWQGCGATIERLLRNGLVAGEDSAFLTGNGVGRPKGALVSDCIKAVNRVEALKIGYEDLVKMEDEFLDSPSGVWVVSKRQVHQLRILEDNSGQLIWADPKNGAPGSLLGRPVVISYRSPAAGAKGDIALCDFGYYLIRDGASVTVTVSPHLYVRERKTIIQIAKSVDGQPWLNAPIAQEDGQTYSPFVVLDVP